MIEYGTKAMEMAGNLGDGMMKAGKQVWFAGLGAVAMAEEKGRGMFEMLVEKGKANEPDKTMLTKAIQPAIDQAMVLGKKVEDAVQETSKAVLHRFGVPTHGEIQALIARVEALTAKVEAMR